MLIGRIFLSQVRLSALGIWQVGAVLGSCIAGGAYVPSACDEAVIDPVDTRKVLGQAIATDFAVSRDEVPNKQAIYLPFVGQTQDPQSQ